MSYNLYVEGDLDYIALSRQQLQSIEIFPIEPNALGIALPSSRADENARAELQRVVGGLLAEEATVYDLMTGDRVTDVDQLLANIFGS